MKTLKFVGTHIAAPLIVSAAATAGFIVGTALGGELVDKIKKSPASSY